MLSGGHTAVRFHSHGRKMGFRITQTQAQRLSLPCYQGRVLRTYGSGTEIAACARLFGCLRCDEHSRWPPSKYPLRCGVKGHEAKETGVKGGREGWLTG